MSEFAAVFRTWHHTRSCGHYLYDIGFGLPTVSIEVENLIGVWLLLNQHFLKVFGFTISSGCWAPTFPQDVGLQHLGRCVAHSHHEVAQGSVCNHTGESASAALHHGVSAAPILMCAAKMVRFWQLGRLIATKPCLLEFRGHKHCKKHEQRGLWETGYLCVYETGSLRLPSLQLSRSLQSTTAGPHQPHSSDLVQHGSRSSFPTSPLTFFQLCQLSDLRTSPWQAGYHIASNDTVGKWSGMWSFRQSIIQSLWPSILSKQSTTHSDHGGVWYNHGSPAIYSGTVWNRWLNEHWFGHRGWVTQDKKEDNVEMVLSPRRDMVLLDSLYAFDPSSTVMRTNSGVKPETRVCPVWYPRPFPRSSKTSWLMMYSSPSRQGTPTRTCGSTLLL